MTQENSDGVSRPSAGVLGPRLPNYLVKYSCESFAGEKYAIGAKIVMQMQEQRRFREYYYGGAAANSEVVYQLGAYQAKIEGLQQRTDEMVAGLKQMIGEVFANQKQFTAKISSLDEEVRRILPALDKALSERYAPKNDICSCGGAANACKQPEAQKELPASAAMVSEPKAQPAALDTVFYQQAVYLHNLCYPLDNRAQQTTAQPGAFSSAGSGARPMLPSKVPARHAYQAGYDYLKQLMQAAQPSTQSTFLDAFAQAAVLQKEAATLPEPPKQEQKAQEIQGNNIPAPAQFGGFKQKAPADTTGATDSADAADQKQSQPEPAAQKTSSYAEVLGPSQGAPAQQSEPQKTSKFNFSSAPPTWQGQPIGVTKAAPPAAFGGFGFAKQAASDAQQRQGFAEQGKPNPFMFLPGKQQ